MPALHKTQAVDHAMMNLARLPHEEVNLLIEQHNVNLHSDDDGFDAIDFCDELEGLTIMDEREFFETYVL